MNTARFDKRLFAYFIDFILSVSITVTGIVCGLVYVESFRLMSWYYILMIALTLNWFIYVIIHSLTLYYTSGRTLGSVITGIRMVHPNLDKLSFKDCLCKCVLLATVPIVLINAAYMLIIHTEKTAFDRMTKTVMVEWRNRIH